jgi:hypothetical protein
MNRKSQRSQRVWAIFSLVLVIAMLLSMVVSSFAGMAR